MKLSENIIIGKSGVHERGQGQRSQVKVKTQFSRFQ